MEVSDSGMEVWLSNTEAEQLRQLLATQAEQHAAQMRELRELVAQTVQLANTAVNAAGQAAAQASAAAAAAPAPPSMPQRASAEIASIVDPKAIDELTTYDGKDSSFHEWETIFLSVAGLLGLEDVMSVAVSQPRNEDVALDQFGDAGVVKQSKALY